MGMAASQARFLQLTARRTNIEYQGQQINQQRLALANASAGLFEKMLTLVPPTPPSSQDDKYYTQGYTFQDTKDDLQKKIQWTSTATTVSGVTFAAPITITAALPANDFVITAAMLNAGLSDTETASVATALGRSLTQDQIDLGYTQVVRYVDVTHDIYDPDGNFKVVSAKSPALLEFDNLNRLLRVTLLEAGATYDLTGTPPASPPHSIGQGDKLTYSGVFDNQRYQDDMNKYEFQKATYDYQIEKINQETKIIQAQDKSLELKMKQLDTEHTAIQTEMDAVQKVIQKNIEGSFKTFA